MDKPFKIVFVCTDNIGRSVISEYLLQDYLKKNNIANIEVSSAGINAGSDASKFSMAHFGELKKMGVDASGHKRRQMDKEIADSADLIIASEKLHQDWIKENIGIEVPLFNKIYK